MKILVCIKQVPDMEAKFRLNQAGDWYDTTDLVWRMNEYDLFAVEQAVQLKEQVGEADVTVLSIGPERVKETIKKALAIGCDRGVHVIDDQDFKRDPYEIASTISEFSGDKGFDVIFTGMQSQDRGSGQVGVLVAELLGLRSVTTIVDFAFADGTITVKRELEGGTRSVIKTALPALLTCQLGLNTPRYPTLPNIMKAKKKELQTVAIEDLLKVKGKQETGEMYFPEKAGDGLVLEGDTRLLADELIEILKERTSIFT